MANGPVLGNTVDTAMSRADTNGNGHKPPAGRVPPHDLEAERALLGAMLYSAEAVEAGLDACAPERFYMPAHSLVFEAVAQLAARSEPVDTVTVADEMGRAGTLGRLESPAFLVSLVARVPSSSSAARYARIVTDHWRLRNLIAAAGDIADMAYDVPPDVDAALDRAESMVFGLADNRSTGRGAEPLRAVLSEWLDELEAAFDGGGPVATPTGFTDLDALTLGLHPGQLVTVAGRTGMGKSSFGAGVALNVARAEQPALLVSVEMGRREIMSRLMANEGRVELQTLRSARLAEMDWARVNTSIGRLADAPLYLCDDPTMTIVGLRSMARRLVSRLGSLGVLVVDYVQLLTSTQRQSENRQVEVAEFSRGLKRLALELKVPVLAMAQLNRGVESRRDKRPSLADLRESGAIENDSDVVVLLYRDDYYNPKSKDAGIAEVHVAKQRNGPLDTVRLAWDGRYQRFANLARQDSLA